MQISSTTRDWGQAFFIVVGLTIGIAGWVLPIGSQEVSQLSTNGVGIVVEEVGEHSALEKAGLRPGDVLYSWKRLPAPPANPEPAEGTFESVFDWMELEIEQAPRGTVRLVGERNGEEVVLEVQPGEWKATLRPRMSAEMLRDYLKGKELIEREEIEVGTDLWKKAAGAIDGQPVAEHLQCWLLFRTGDAWATARQWGKAQTAYRSALASAHNSLTKVMLWNAIGRAYTESSKFKMAQEAYKTARTILNNISKKDFFSAQTLDLSGRSYLLQDDPEKATISFEKGLAIYKTLAPGSLSKASILIGLGTASLSRGKLDLAAAYYRESFDIYQEIAPRSLDMATNLQGLGHIALDHGKLDRAEELYNEAMRLRQELAPDSLDVAASFENFGHLASARGDLEKTEEFHRKSLAIRNRLAPGGLGVAVNLSNIGNVKQSLGQMDEATRYHRKALKIFQELTPDGLDVATMMYALGNTAFIRGELSQAVDFYEASLSVRQRLAPGSLAVAGNLNNLGAVAARRGDLVRAAEYFRESLQIRQKVAPGSFDEASSWTSLSILATLRRDLVRAAEYSRASLEIKRKLMPGSLDIAVSLSSLGNIAWTAGDFDLATSYFREALEIQTKASSRSIDVARSLGNLGGIARERGHFDQAVNYHEKALDLLQISAPNSLEVSSNFYSLGIVAYNRESHGRATEYLHRALEIQRRLAPDSTQEARSLYFLASNYQEDSQLQLALSLFYQAIQKLENQISRLGGTRGVQASFRADHGPLYLKTINAEIELHQKSKAFQTLERFRAQSFLAQLTERSLTFSNVPEELLNKRQRLAWSYDKTQNELARLHPLEQAGEVEGLLSSLLQIRWDYEDITEQIIRASPRLGALRYPKPLNLEATRQTLDPGTVMLSYSVGKSRTHLFILDREDELRIETLEFGEKELRSEVEKILELQKRHAVPALYTEPLRQAGERLYETLIQPAEGLIAKSERILIVPDGPLHLLPFALLVRKTGPKERDFEYLVEWKPLHSVLSATVYAELKKQRRSEPEDSRHAITLAAFGDPQFPTASSGETFAEDHDLDAYVRAAAERGFDFRPLPYSREEVNRVVALYPEGNAQAYLGTEASEERAKAIGKSARILHFATHGRYDHHIPLNSYVALTIPTELHEGQENGLLQAWEIYEDVRLDADLVVLSACESGLGDELAMEGLIGLTRAFQFAGARTVASSLWQVEDWATAELMERLYRHLRSGKTKDEALRAAQLELIRGSVETMDREGRVVKRDLSSPYYWAAFQMIGDWR